MTVDSSLILPGSLEFVLAAQSLPPPPGWLDEAHRKGGNVALIAPLGQSGMLEVVSPERAWEYANDGELDQRMEEIEALESEDLLWLPGDPLE